MLIQLYVLQSRNIQTDSDKCFQRHDYKCSFQLECQRSCDDVYDFLVGLSLFLIGTNSVDQWGHGYHRCF